MPRRSVPIGRPLPNGRTIAQRTFASRRASEVSTLPAVVDALHRIAAAMREVGIRWYLFGAQAAIVWGSPRLSADVDVTVDLPRDTITQLIDAMRRQGFDAVFDD